MRNRLFPILTALAVLGLAAPAFADPGCKSMFDGGPCLALTLMLCIPAYLVGLVLNAIVLHTPLFKRLQRPLTLPVIGTWLAVLFITVPLLYDLSSALGLYKYDHLYGHLPMVEIVVWLLPALFQLPFSIVATGLVRRASLPA